MENYLSNDSNIKKTQVLDIENLNLSNVENLSYGDLSHGGTQVMKYPILEADFELSHVASKLKLLIKKTM